jgi:putative ABC transport system ATP-binding protein
MNNLDLHVSDLLLEYPLPDGQRLKVLDISDFIVKQGNTIGIMGPSGCGKTSLLYVLSGIENPQLGVIQWGEINIAALPAAGRDRWRYRNIGFIFQDFHLIPKMTPLENVLLPVYFQNLAPSPRIKIHAENLLKEVGLNKCTVTVEKLSRGEMQRVAIARALILSPQLILADEPTGSLDRETSDSIIDLLVKMANNSGVTLIVVSHDQMIMRRLQKVYALPKGQLMEVSVV